MCIYLLIYASISVCIPCTVPVPQWVPNGAQPPDAGSQTANHPLIAMLCTYCITVCAPRVHSLSSTTWTATRVRVHYLLLLSTTIRITTRVHVLRSGYLMCMHKEGDGPSEYLLRVPLPLSNTGTVLHCVRGVYLVGA